MPVHLTCVHCGAAFSRPPSYRGQRYCSRACRYTPRPVAERFWEKVDRRGPNNCWPWRGSFFSGKTYGQFTLAPGINHRAHRVAWELTHGPIPPGLVVMHVVCDNPPCCNPAHLALGTLAQNNLDRARKGRSSSGDAHWTRRHPERVAQYSRSGSANAAAKLTEDDVRAIRHAHATGETGVSIAARYGVSYSLISQIMRQRIWKHVT